MKDRTKLGRQINEWVAAGLIDATTAESIRSFESRKEHRTSLRWPVILALTFGGILLAAGITLFVAAHWGEMSPAARFTLVLLMVAVFHIAAAFVAPRFPALATTFHGLGTICLGAGIYLTAQIFNLHEDWPTGILLWALGAAIGYAALRDWVQATLLALLSPSWLIAEWEFKTYRVAGAEQPLAIGLLLTCLAYLSARAFDEESVPRKAMVWIGGIALLPCAVIAIGFSSGNLTGSYWSLHASFITMFIGWCVAILAPLGLSFVMQGKAATWMLLWAAWSYAITFAAEHMYSDYYHRTMLDTGLLYVLCAGGSVGLAAWGLAERRKERVNLGIAGFAISVLFFYFDNFMAKLDRSASLLLLGAICLAGGYVLEITRRRLMARMEAEP